MSIKSRQSKKPNKLLSGNRAQLSCTQEVASHHAVSKVVSSNARSIGLVVALAFGVYFNALFNGFVWDDTSQIVGNYWLRDFRYLGAIFTHNVWAFNDSAPSNYYRPMMNLIYMINYHLFGLQPWGYHLVNILFHTGTSVLVFFLTREIFKSEYAATRIQSIPLVAAILFAVHPIHTEAVTWIAGLPDISYSFFYLASLLLYIRSSRMDLNYLVSLGSFFIAALCKEPALTLPLSLIVIDYGIKKGPIPFKRYIPYFGVLGLYLVIRISALGGFAPLITRNQLSSYEALINIVPLCADYFRQLVLPLNLNFMHKFSAITSLVSERGLISLLIVLIYGTSVCFAFKKNRAIFVGLLLIVLTLLPVFYISKIEGGRPYWERYLYLPSTGFVIVAAYYLRYPEGKFKKIFIGVIVLIAGLYSAETIQRNTVWKDDHSILLDVVKKSPDDSEARLHLGYEDLNRGEIDDAIFHLQKAIELNSPDLRAYLFLGDAYFRKGFSNEAIQTYRTLIALKPEIFEAHRALGLIYDSISYPEEAIREYEVAVSLRPGDAECLRRIEEIRKTHPK